MRIAYLVFNVDGMGGTSRSAITQANALVDVGVDARVNSPAGGHDVRLVSITRSADEPHYAIDDRIAVTRLVDVRDEAAPRVDGVPESTARLLHARQSALVPRRWDRQFTALCDVAMEAFLPTLDVDVIVTVTPGLLAAAVELTPDAVVVVHQEHRSSNERTGGLEPLLTYAPRADVVALLAPSIESWLREQLGDLAPHTVVVPNPLPLGFTPRSTLEEPLIMAAGRLVAEKQFAQLISAFAQIAHTVPLWRLRICGDGPQRLELVRQIRKFDLWDRVELPGRLPDMAAEWPKASVAALTSRAEGFPLVLQEAMAAGVPVVSFDCPSGPREIIEHDVNGLLVAPQSTTGMAAALLRLTADPDLRARLGRGGLQTARRYDAQVLAQRWLGIFDDARTRRAHRGSVGRLGARALATPPDRAPDPSTGVTAPGVTPAAARHAALDLAVRAARAATDTWLVLPAHETASPTVVVPMTARDAYLAALAGDGAGGLTHPEYLCLRDPAAHGWHERRGRVATLASDLRRGRTSVLHLEPWPVLDGRPSVVGQGCSVEVQFWESAPDGRLVAPRHNPYADRLPRALDPITTTVDGVEVQTLALMVEPTVTECRFPVDVVYTWVDGNDPAWDDARRRALAALPGTATARTRESSGRARFVDRGELRYSMRSIHLFAPWVRRIHLVTAGQVPSWLDTSHPAINLVDHRDILPADGLPTFNSHAIETSLHRIDRLAEHFVYFNDDFLLGRPIRPEALFSPAGHTAVFVAAQTIGLGDAPDAAPFLKAAWNNRALLQGAFGAVATSNLAHAPYAHRVSVLRELTERFPDTLAATARSPFRSEHDVSTLSALAQHYGLLTGTACVRDLGEDGLAYVDLSNADADRRLSRLSARAQDFICLADHHDHALAQERLDELLDDFFTSYYPVAAPWERG